MGKRKPRAPDNRGPLQRMIDRNTLDRRAKSGTNNPARGAAKGGYKGDKRPSTGAGQAFHDQVRGQKAKRSPNKRR